MDKEKFINSGLLEQHVLGLTSPEEDQIVRQHLEAFPDLRQEVDNLHQAMNQYAIMHAIPPNKEEQAISSPALHNSYSSNTEQHTTFNWSLLAAILLAVFSFYLFRSNQQQQLTITQLEAEYAALKTYHQDDQEKTRAQILILAKIQDPNTMSIVLNGPTGHFAIAYWNPTLKEAWLDPTKLPAILPGKQYHIWGQVDEKMINIGSISPNSRALIPVQYFDNAKSIRITQEDISSTPSITSLEIIAEGHL